MAMLVTLGEPLSVNVELIHHCLSRKLSVPLIVAGSWKLFCEQSEALGRSVAACKLVRAGLIPEPGMIHFWDVGAPPHQTTATLTVAERGRIAMEALSMVEHVQVHGSRLAVLTCPIDKAACVAAGFPFPGQTEFFAKVWQDEAIMILAGPRLRVALATNHLPISQVAAALDEPLVYRKIRLLARSLSSYWKISQPRIAVCGLNPHCGDQGLFGDEESRIIAPAVHRAAAEGIQVSGPWPADTVFHGSLQGRFDAVLAMYHDQGLGPLKTVHFYDAINVSGGLRHLRCSPDHGPAADLFLGKKAQPDSMQAAWDFCLNYLES